MIRFLLALVCVVGADEIDPAKRHASAVSRFGAPDSAGTFEFRGDIGWNFQGLGQWCGKKAALVSCVGFPDRLTIAIDPRSRRARLSGDLSPR